MKRSRAYSKGNIPINKRYKIKVLAEREIVRADETKTKNRRQVRQAATKSQKIKKFSVEKNTNTWKMEGSPSQPAKLAPNRGTRNKRASFLLGSLVPIFFFSSQVRTELRCSAAGRPDFFLSSLAFRQWRE